MLLVLRSELSPGIFNTVLMLLSYFFSTFQHGLDVLLFTSWHFQHALDATLRTFLTNFQYGLDATIFTFSVTTNMLLMLRSYHFRNNFQHALGAMLLTFSWDFQHGLDATL